jgi:hypothetical protein
VYFLVLKTDKIEVLVVCIFVSMFSKLLVEVNYRCAYLFYLSF